MVSFYLEQGLILTALKFEGVCVSNVRVGDRYGADYGAFGEVFSNHCRRQFCSSWRIIGICDLDGERLCICELGTVLDLDFHGVDILIFKVEGGRSLQCGSRDGKECVVRDGGLVFTLH